METFRYKTETEWKEMNSREFTSDIKTTDDSVVLVCGSLITGYGNSNSDFDIHVFNVEKPTIKKTDFAVNDWIVNEHSEWVDLATFKPDQKMKGTWNFSDKYKSALDVRYWTFDEFAETLAEYEERYKSACVDLGFIRTPQLMLYGIGDSTALAKIFQGVCIRGHDKFSGISSGFGLEHYCYLAYRYHAPTYDEFRDIAGAFLSRDYDNALEFCRIYLELCAWSFSHILLNPNTNRKWIPMMVRNWPDNYQSFSDRYIELYNRATDTTEKKISYILDGVTLADDIFRAAYIEQITNPVFNKVEEVKAFWSNKLMGVNNEMTEQSKLEYDWYSRLFTDDFLPADKLIEKHEV